jgi:hypothetical protein
MAPPGSVQGTPHITRVTMVIGGSGGPHSCAIVLSSVSHAGGDLWLINCDFVADFLIINQN